MAALCPFATLVPADGVATSLLTSPELHERLAAMVDEDPGGHDHGIFE